MKEFAFNFKMGGWNSVFANSREEAIEIIKDLYPDRVYMKVDMDSITELGSPTEEPFIPKPRKMRRETKK